MSDEIVGKLGRGGPGPKPTPGRRPPGQIGGRTEPEPVEPPASETAQKPPPGPEPAKRQPGRI
jgi:hypothetical protein